MSGRELLSLHLSIFRFAWRRLSFPSNPLEARYTFHRIATHASFLSIFQRSTLYGAPEESLVAQFPRSPRMFQKIENQRSEGVLPPCTSINRQQPTRLNIPAILCSTRVLAPRETMARTSAPRRYNTTERSARQCFRDG